MAHSFGKLTGRKLTIDGVDYLGLYDKNDIEWHDLFASMAKFDHYIAIDEDNRVISMEADPEHSQIPDREIIGIWENETGGFKNINNGNTVYGCIWDGNQIIPKPVAIPDISDRQFFQQLAIDDLITEDEAVDAVATGTIPAAMSQFIASLPPEQQFPARMVLKGATSFSRSHPLVAQFGAGIGMTPPQIDKLWLDAALL